jgi:adenylylsulfate kinase
MKILIMGLPGSGKTTFGKLLSKHLGAAFWDADDVRSNINKHLGFTVEDRLQQSASMGWLCDRVNEAGLDVVCAYVCPTPEARRAFGQFGPPDILIWMNNIDAGRFADTNRIFVPPDNPDVVIDYFPIVPANRDWQIPNPKTLNRALEEVMALVEEKRNGSDNRFRTGKAG